MTSVEMQPPAARRAPVDVGASVENAAAARLYETFSEQLMRFCARRLDSRSEAEDAVQVTFLYALRALQRGVVPESESAWLYAIATNVCRWQRRTVSRRGPHSDEVDLDRIAAETRADGDEEGLCRDLEEALRSIPVTQRRALVLREWHGLSSNEVATRLGLSAPATYALLTRARRSFIQAFNARREAVMGLQLGALLHELRLQLKALFGTASAKAAAVATVAGVGVVGIAVERSVDADESSPPPVRAAAIEPARASAATALSTERPTARADRARSASRPPGTQFARAGVRTEPDGGSRVAVAVPPRPAGEPAPAPSPEPRSDPAPPEQPTTPTTEPLPAVPLEPPALPDVDLPTDLLPPVEVPPLPPVPPLPTEDVPAPDVPVPELPVPDLPLP